MRKKICLMLILAIVGVANVNAQMRISGSEVPNQSAVLDLNPDDNTLSGNATLGLALPRVSLRNSGDAFPLSAHVKGMTIYNMATAGDVTPGVYINNGTKWLLLLDRNTPFLTAERDSIVGNEVTDATVGGGLMRSGAGTEISPYTLGIATGGVTTDKIADRSVTTAKLSESTINELKEKFSFVFDYNNPVFEQKVINLIQANDKDSTVGNEVVDATVGGGLMRSGAGTEISPYTLGIATNGVTTDKIADRSVTLEKLSDRAIFELREIVPDIHNSVLKELVLNLIFAHEQDGVIGNEVTDATVGGGLVRSGAGTEISPYTLGIATGGVTTDKIADRSVTAEKLSESTLNELKFVFDYNNPTFEQKVINLIKANDKDSIVGNEVVNATANGGLVRSGAGTQASPYTLGIATNGVTTDKIADKSVTTAKLSESTLNELKFDYNNPTFEQKVINLIHANEKDGVVGNEVVGATDGSLQRSGAGTQTSPYTLSVSENGIDTKHIKNSSVTMGKLSSDVLGKLNEQVKLENLSPTNPNSILVSDASGKIKTQKVLGNAITCNYSWNRLYRNGWGNFGYAEQTVPAGLYLAHVHINDNTEEGLIAYPINYVIIDAGGESIYSIPRQYSEIRGFSTTVESCLIYVFKKTSNIRLFMHVQTPTSSGTASIVLHPIIQLN